MKSQSKHDGRTCSGIEKIVLLTEPQDFEREVSQEERLVLVSFLGENLNDSCQRKVLQRTMEGLAGDFKFCLVDELVMDTLAAKCRVRGTPTFIVFLRGKEKGRKVGRVDEGRLKRFLIGILADTSTGQGSQQRQNV